MTVTVPPVLALEAPGGAAFTFLVLFVVVLAGPAIMSRARVPGIIGLLIGGWAIGPHGLGLIGQGNQTVPELGQFGLLYLMFSAGLELDLGVLRVYRRRAVAFGTKIEFSRFGDGSRIGRQRGRELEARRIQFQRRCDVGSVGQRAENSAG